MFAPARLVTRRHVDLCRLAGALCDARPQHCCR
ncbi:putative leader peptide [Kitasatospora sp. NPDC002040]